MATELAKAEIVEKTNLTDDLMILRIKPEIPFSFKPGQYCTIGIDGIERPYSIVSSPHEESIELFLELVLHGELTPKLWHLKVRDVVSIRPRAKGVFTFDERYPNHFMVATVTGIAPLISMIRNYLRQGLSSHTFYVLDGASYKDELAYKDELERLSREHKNIIYIPTVSRPEEERNKGWEGEEGRVNSLVEEYLEKFSLDPASTLVYACGHPGMIEEVKQIALGKGYKFKEEKFWRE